MLKQQVFRLLQILPVSAYSRVANYGHSWCIAIKGLFWPLFHRWDETFLNRNCIRFKRKERNVIGVFVAKGRKPTLRSAGAQLLLAKTFEPAIVTFQIKHDHLSFVT
jgi:hypothetical protein